MKSIIFSVTIALMLILTVGCGSTPTAKKEQEKSKTLVEYVKAGSVNVEDAKKAMMAVGISDSVVATLKNNIAIYRITYNSTFQGDSIVLSGFVSIPDGVTISDTMRHIQYNHGMLTPYENSLGMGVKDAPSLYGGKRSTKDSTKKSLEARLFGLGLAGNGFFVSMPDYMGYGQSEDREHPLLYTEELKIEATDMAIAARELAHILGFTLDSGIYLTGWSEGGSVALAQHRFMESTIKEVPVKGTAALAGVYNPSKWGENLGSIDKNRAGILSWMLYSHLTNGGDTTITKSADIWVNPIKKQRDAVNKVMGKQSREIFTPKFLKSGRSIATKLLSISDNHTGWRPLAPIHLHHGDKDNLVEFAQSSNALTSLKKMGADSITLTTYQGGDHRSPLETFFISITENFIK